MAINGSVVGICMVKDELDILPSTIKHMVNQVDAIIVFDDGSTDGTLEWLRDTGNVHLITRDIFNDISWQAGRAYLSALQKVGYYQSRKMTALAMEAYYQHEASWVVPFDADEIWTSQWGTIAEVCKNHEDTYGIIQAELFDHMVTGLDQVPLPFNRYTANITPIDYMPWRRVNSLPMPKVACRTASDLVIAQGNHWANYKIPARATTGCPIVVHHYPYRSHEQFIRKVRNGGAAYAATNLPETMGAHWRQWNKFTDEQLKDLFDTYYYVFDPTKPYELDGEMQPALYRDPQHV